MSEFFFNIPLCVQNFASPFICWWTFELFSLFGRASLIAQSVKNLPARQETWVWFLGWEDPLEKVMATHSSTLAWNTPWTEGPGRGSVRVTRVGHDLATKPLPPFGNREWWCYECRGVRICLSFYFQFFGV